MVLLCVIIKRVWHTGHFEYSCMRCSCTTENKRHYDFKKIAKETTNNQDKKYNSVKHLQRTIVIHEDKYWEWSVSENSEGHMKNLADINRPWGVCYFFKMNSRQEYRSKLSFFTTNILQNVFPLFAVRKCVKAFKVLYIKPGMILGQLIVSNLKTLPQKTTLDFMNYQEKKHQMQ